VELKELFPQEELQRRKAALEAYEAWEARRSPEPSPRDLFERLDALRALLPAELRVPKADADYEGIRLMHEALAVLGPSK
jgi:hypothetical protein